MNIKCWGTPGWTFIHIVALSYPDNPSIEDKYNYKIFFTNIQHILPCKICGNHYKKNLNKHELTDNILSSSDELFKWTVRMHNEVNILNNKKVIDYDKARELLIYNCNKTTNNESTNNESTNNEFTNNESTNNESTNNEYINNKITKYNYYYIIIIIILIIIIIFLLFNKFNLKKYN